MQRWQQKLPNFNTFWCIWRCHGTIWCSGRLSKGHDESGEIEAPIHFTIMHVRSWSTASKYIISISIIPLGLSPLLLVEPRQFFGQIHIFAGEIRTFGAFFGPIQIFRAELSDWSSASSFKARAKLTTCWRAMNCGDVFSTRLGPKRDHGLITWWCLI